MADNNISVGQHLQNPRLHGFTFEICPQPMDWEHKEVLYFEEG